MVRVERKEGVRVAWRRARKVAVAPIVMKASRRRGVEAGLAGPDLDIVG